MDVDQISSSSKPPPISPPATPSEKRSKYILPDDELNKITEDMKSFLKFLHPRTPNGSDDWRRLSAFIVEQLTLFLEALASPRTKIKLTKNPADIIKFASQEELEQWIVGVQSGIEKNDWTTLMELLLEPSVKPINTGFARERHSTDPESQAIMASWKAKYVGTSPDLFELVLGDYMQFTHHYAFCVSHLQSSGTGKSRVHDELAKRIFYDTCSFPPPDPQVKKWFEIETNLSSPVNQQAVQNRCNAFLLALLYKTRDELDQIVTEHLAQLRDLEQRGHTKENAKKRVTLLSREFRKKMAEGGTFEKHGDYRSNFYDEVFRLAEVFERGKDGNEMVRSIAQEIVDVLDPTRCCRTEPLMVICWDDANFLNDQIPNVPWTLFSGLRRALRTIRDFPFFSIFVTTAYNLEFVPPPPAYGPSSRISFLVLDPYAPITEVGFDEFASKVDSKGSWTLAQVASTYHMAHLGRPLFATRYDCGSDLIKQSIITFAQEKLLCRKLVGDTSLSDAESLACLAIRLGLDFKSTSWTDRRAERIQVERHMRLCLSATAGFQKMVTISPSEPLLAEAAYSTMSTHLDMDQAPQALLRHFDMSEVDLGDSGEVIAALLLSLARDKATRDKTPLRAIESPSANERQDDRDGQSRVLTVLEFLDALLPPNTHKDVKIQTPFRFTTGHGEVKLEDAFARGHIWFNHFIKINDYNMVNRQYLWSLMSRGAAIICPNNQRNVDIVIPILFDNHLKPESISAILVQVKNDPSCAHNVRTSLFKAMDPFRFGLFSKGDKPAFPIIRMVFALASQISTVTRPTNPEDSSSGKASAHRYTAYDIWVAGTTQDSFGVISQNGRNVYKDLTERTSKVSNVYALLDQSTNSAEQVERMANARRRMLPGTSTNLEHQKNYVSFEKEIEMELDDSGD
ncbi:hypothetical protein CPB84DRAFT_1796248 [Gymnopilus junonius]|uniref:Uncharacterized protein n=1 Tax=Gymnopilus junonius TaxID=109634 RepID=A0A9P5TFU2_GYMJU|nr:hypothetical protein CPB84DRAFT_1796248 [Gymnopilus junonius]